MFLCILVYHKSAKEQWNLGNENFIVVIFCVNFRFRVSLLRVDFTIDYSNVPHIISSDIFISYERPCITLAQQVTPYEMRLMFITFVRLDLRILLQNFTCLM